MSTRDDSPPANKKTKAQKNYERIMKTIEPFIPRPEKSQPPPRDVWRRGEDLPGEFEERFSIEHHAAPRQRRNLQED